MVRKWGFGRLRVASSGPSITWFIGVVQIYFYRFMKQKEQNRQINLSLILNSTKQRLKFLVGIHTTMKEIANLLAEELCLDVFRTRISFQQPYKTAKLDEAKTLNQLGLNSSAETLYANVETIHTKQLGRVTLAQKFEKPIERYRVSDLDLVPFHPGQIQPYEVDGLTLEGYELTLLVEFASTPSVSTSSGKSCTPSGWAPITFSGS